MRKIKTIRQLKAEKKSLELRRGELKKAIHNDWVDLKRSLSPSNLADKWSEKKDTGIKSIIAGSLSKLADGLVEKLAGRAESKLFKWFKK